MSDSNLTNQALGDALGVTHAQASRYRSGDRVPTDLVMLKIAVLMDWPVEEQIRLKHRQLSEKRPADQLGPYAAEFVSRESIAAQKLAGSAGE